MWKLLPFLKPYRKQAIVGPLFKFLEAVLELTVPLVMIRLVDRGVAERDIPYIWRMAGLLVLIAAVSWGFALICQYSASIASQGTGTLLRNALYEKVSGMSHAQLDKLGTHSLITRITNDVNQLQTAVAMLIRLVVRAPFLAVGAVFMAMTIDLRLSLVFVVVMPLIALILYLIMSRSVPYFRAIQKKLDRISLYTRESLSGVRVIRAFARQKEEEEKFYAAGDDLAETSVRVGKLSALLSPLTSLVMNGGIAVILFCSGSQVNIGRLTQGEIIAFVNYMTQVMLALVVVANLVVIFTRASASAARVNEVLAIEPDITSPKDPIPFPADRSKPAVEFAGVSFSYHADAESLVLQDISFSVSAGETIGVIGGTGSGKSTLVQLIPRYYDATEGEVRLFGADSRRYDLQELHRKIAVVPQYASVLSGRLRDTLSMAAPDASEEWLWHALSVAQAIEFVEKLPNGLDTLIDQGGKNLSGGQKQRLTIARALVGDPDILILDDSASALDYATDAALRHALRTELSDMTVFIVSQRVSAIRHADRILVLDDGKPVGLGTHADLLAGCPVYREICASQPGEEGDDE